MKEHHDHEVAGPALISVEAHMFFLAEEPGTADRSPVTPHNGLVHTNHPSVTTIVTGIASGDVTVTTETRQDAPATVDLDGWEEVIDHSLPAPLGAVRILTLKDGPADLPSLTPYGPGPYRLRVHARGRDIAYDGVTFEPVEDYHLITWPAPHAPDHIHRRTDQAGASWRLAVQRSAARPPPPHPNPRGSGSGHRPGREPPLSPDRPGPAWTLGGGETLPSARPFVCELARAVRGPAGYRGRTRVEETSMTRPARRSRMTGSAARGYVPHPADLEVEHVPYGLVAGLLDCRVDEC